MGLRCEECSEDVLPNEYRYLAGKKEYKEGDAYIIHTTCVEDGRDVILETFGELALVRMVDTES